jgi:hypothetical protein
MVRSTNRSADKTQKQETGVNSLNVRVHRFDIIQRILLRTTEATANKIRCLHFAPSHVEFQQKVLKK